MKRTASLSLITEKGKILAVSKSDETPLWGLPGGKAEHGETAECAAVRELLEETGYLCLDEWPTKVFEYEEGDFYVQTFKIDKTVKLSGGPVNEPLISKFVTPEDLINPTKARFPEYNARLLCSLRWEAPRLPRRIFVLGASQSGKTTLAEKLAFKLGCLRVSAGAWLRALHPSSDREVLDSASSQELQRNPDYAINWVSACCIRITDSSNSNIIIEGVRNPRDFHSLWDPNRDVCIFILNNNAYTGFDSGVLAIEESVAWWKENICPDSLSTHVFMSEFDNFVENFHNF